MKEELLEVTIDSMKMESYDVSQQELLNTLSLNNQLVPAGFLDTGAGRFNIKVPGLIEDPEDVARLAIKQNGEGVVTVSDIAEIRRTFKDASRYTLVNGQPAISIQVVKRLGTNIIENNLAVRQIVEASTKGWPETIKIDFLLSPHYFPRWAVEKWPQMRGNFRYGGAAYNFDHPKAPAVYQRAGFVAYGQESKLIDDPRREGAMPPGQEF